MKTFNLIAIATAAALPALAAHSATGPAPLNGSVIMTAETESLKTAELSERERGTDIAELSAEERGTDIAELSAAERGTDIAELSERERDTDIA